MAFATALLLRDKLGVSEFAALTFRQAPEAVYLQEETKGLFSKILSETEMHRQAATAKPRADFIDLIEPLYGLPFWQYVTQNRFLTMKRANYLHQYGTPYSREELVAHVQTRFDMTQKFVDAFKPDVIVFPVDVGPSSALILERIAKQRGIQIFVPVSSKIGSYHTLIDTVFSEAKNLEARFQALQKGRPSSNIAKAKALITTFRQGSVVPSYVQGVTTDNFEKNYLSNPLLKEPRPSFAAASVKPCFRKKKANSSTFLSGNTTLTAPQATTAVLDFVTDSILKTSSQAKSLSSSRFTSSLSLPYYFMHLSIPINLPSCKT